MPGITSVFMLYSQLTSGLLLTAVKAIQHAFSDNSYNSGAWDRALNPTFRERQGLFKAKEPNCSISNYLAERSYFLPRDRLSRTNIHHPVLYPIWWVVHQIHLAPALRKTGSSRETRRAA